MTWEETIEYIRQDVDYARLVVDAYFDKDLSANVERFSASAEFAGTIRLLESQGFKGGIVVDIGSGNGIASICFARLGNYVISVEPDASETIGAGATRKLRTIYGLEKEIEVVERYGEATGIQSSYADLVYIRQAMHHAGDLSAMLAECYRILKKGGLLLTVRDHVVFDERDKDWFLKTHPLHRFYGGENAYTEDEYLRAIKGAGFIVERTIRYYDSVINYYPMTEHQVRGLPAKVQQKLEDSLSKGGNVFAKSRLFRRLYILWSQRRTNPFDERRVPGRMYSFLAVKR